MHMFINVFSSNMSYRNNQSNIENDLQFNKII